MSDAPILRMRRDLSLPVPEPSWPAGVSVRGFADGDAAAVHALLERAYANGGGSVAALAEWFPAMTGDPEFDPDLWFMARAGDALAGVALCWTSAFLKDLAVDDTWRRHGLGTALLHHLLGEFAARGAARVDLKVDAGNPSGARRVYERAGFVVVEQLPS